MKGTHMVLQNKGALSKKPVRHKKQLSEPNKPRGSASLWQRQKIQEQLRQGNRILTAPRLVERSNTFSKKSYFLFPKSSDLSSGCREDSENT